MPMPLPSSIDVRSIACCRLNFHWFFLKNSSCMFIRNNTPSKLSSGGCPVDFRLQSHDQISSFFYGITIIYTILLSQYFSYKFDFLIRQQLWFPTRVGTLKDGYIHRVPLPRVPQIQSTSEHVAAVTQDSRNTCYSQVP
jgi:hypothetical protein